MPQNKTPKRILQMRNSQYAKDRPDPPTPHRGAPAPPAWLSDTALELWGDIVPKLDDAGILCEVDVLALAACCDMYALYLEAMADLRDRGSVVEGRQGEKKRNPSATVANQALSHFEKLAGKLGLTPVARESVAAKATDETDNSAGYFAR